MSCSLYTTATVQRCCVCKIWFAFHVAVVNCMCKVWIAVHISVVIAVLILSRSCKNLGCLRLWVCSFRSSCRASEVLTWVAMSRLPRGMCSAFAQYTEIQSQERVTGMFRNCLLLSWNHAEFWLSFENACVLQEFVVIRKLPT